MSRIITVANQKGGSGKSTCVQIKANIFSQDPYNLTILVIDLDPQVTQLQTRWEDLQIYDHLPTFDVITLSVEGYIEFLENLIDDSTSNNNIIDKGILIGRNGLDAKNRNCFATNFKRIVERSGDNDLVADEQILYNYNGGNFLENYDIILIDMPGSIKSDTDLSSILTTSDGVIIPYKPNPKDKKSTATFIKILKSMAEVRKNNFNLDMQIAAYINEHRNTKNFNVEKALTDDLGSFDIQLFNAHLRVRNTYVELDTMSASLFQKAIDEMKNKKDNNVNQNIELKNFTKELEKYITNLFGKPSILNLNLQTA